MQSLSIRNLNVWYGKQHALKSINLNMPLGQITAVIGPSGCGKSTLLKSLNRLLDLDEQVRVSGQVLLNGRNIYDRQVDATETRTRIGLLAQKPFPLPLSIYDNVAYGPRIHGRTHGNLNAIVQSRLEAVGLWDEVRDRLKSPAKDLSVGQQQRLCLARSLAVEPEILLCDESTASLDPISARGIETLLRTLKGKYTVIMVTHDIDQARRLADYVAFMWLGELVEHGPVQPFFAQPVQKLTQAYLAREIG
ncbi:MAG: phosphate ABC transporter ATP-binding protein [Anaerolineaceae bacterium]|nr:phosphate ABC transporter ATP-binding protein [Anaerolineaceae bacterium]